MNSRQAVTKKKAWTRKGVSDIIGNILILAITVTLFTSILWFVSSMPGPAEKVYTDFTPKVELDPVKEIANITLTHKGGNTLEDYRTNIYIFVNNVPQSYNLSDGGIYSGEWSTGIPWKVTLTGTPMSTVLSVMVVDNVANTVVYQAPLLGNSQADTSLPIIGERGMNPSPTYADNDVTFYAVIFDSRGTLNKSSVTLDASSIGKGTIELVYSGDNTYRSSSTYKASTSWNGAVVYVNAKDIDGNALTPARLILSVLNQASGGGGGGSPYDNYPGSLVNGTYPPNASGGNSGGSLGTTFYYIMNSEGEVTRDFEPGERVFIELWSDTIKNMAYGNTVNLIWPLTGQAMSPQSSTTAFVAHQQSYGFYKYTYNFTAPSQSYTYTLEIQVKDNTGKSTNIADTIVVGGREYPALETYKLDADTGNLIKTTKFNHTDTLYLLIKTRDVDLSAQTVLLGDLQIRDFSGTYIVQKSGMAYNNPPSYERPMSSLFKTDGLTKTPITSAGGAYTLYLVLYEAYQGWWLPGTNTYTLKIDSIQDTGSGGGIGEIYSSLSCQFEVTAPVTTTDILASLGSGAFTWSASGAAWESNKIVWYQGGNRWDSQEIDLYPSDGPLALGLFDINGDGWADAVVGSQSSTSANIVWYENRVIDGLPWSDANIISAPFDAVSGTTEEDYSVYHRDRGWQSNYKCINELCAQISIADLDGNGKGDIIASFIHVVVWTSASSEDNANSGNSFGMFFNRGIYVFWNDGKWTKTTLYSTTDWTSSTVNSNSNPAASDIATGDLNQDGYPDVVAVYQDGTTKVWLNQWTQQTGDNAARQKGTFGSAPIVLKDSTVLGGTNPWDHNKASQNQPLVEIADMDGNGYPDIIRTSTADNNIYILYTEPTGSDLQSRAPSVEFNIDSNQAATITGSKANLAADDGTYETLTESYVNYANQTLHAGSATGDDTLETLANTYHIDSQYYVVNAGKTMSLNGFAPPSGYASKIVSKATLQVTWTTSGSYSGGAQMQFSVDGGLTWDYMGFSPTSAGSREIDLLARGVDTWEELNTLRIKFYNPTGSGGSVSFDHVGLDIQFVKTSVLGYQWEIPNVQRAFHNLTMVAYVSGSESFHIQYSVDNETWFDAFTVSSTTEKTYYKLLPYTPNDRYYIRAIDADNGTTDTGKDTLSIDMLVINHYTQTVEWDAPAKVTKFASSTNAITALTVGDITTDGGYGSLNDIVFATAKVSTYETLYIATQYSPKLFDIKPVVTGLLGTYSDTVYDSRAVQLGDIDGDGDLDIALVIGYSFGQDSGTAPTLWIYYNNQQHDTSNRWTFLEEPVSQLGDDAAINIVLGNIDLTIFLPLVGVVGIVAANVAVERASRRRKT